MTTLFHVIWLHLNTLSVILGINNLYVQLFYFTDAAFIEYENTRFCEILQTVKNVSFSQKLVPKIFLFILVIWGVYSLEKKLVEKKSPSLSDFFAIENWPENPNEANLPKIYTS